jgi:hypothetical protein
MRRAKALAVCVLALGCPAASAASFGESFDSYRDLHKKTAYGSLFFNEGAIRQQDNQSLKRFKMITGTGDIDLPRQQGYCFVLNHYGRPNGTDKRSRLYRAKITKEFQGGKPTTVEMFEKAFSPTDELASPNLPSVCISGTRNVSKVTIDFRSDDGDMFDTQIGFAPR